MSNIAIPTEQTPAAATRERVFAMRSVLAFIVLAVVWISFTPFVVVTQRPDAEADGGRLINQLGYSGVLLLALLALLVAVDRRALLRFFSFGWAAMYLLVALSAFAAADTASALRSVMFALIATTMAGTIVLLAPSAGTLARILAGGAVAVLGLSYAGLILLPEAAIHPASGVEAFHAGLWRGIYSHKNMAGPLMASLVFVGIYLMRRGQHWLGAGIAVLALIFVWNTGSKTSAALAPAIVIMVLLPAMTGMRTLAAIAVLAAIISINALTIGSVFVPGFDAILRTFNETTTFTGRTEIWEFAGDFVLQRPWTGFGFDSFWGTGITADAEQPFDRAWDPRGIIHGHNGFLDIALFMGVPAMLLAVWLFVIAPVWQYIRTPSLLENALLADLCLMIVAFLVMNSALESYFFRRADPAWLTLVIALMGLRLCARQRIVDR